MTEDVAVPTVNAWWDDDLAGAPLVLSIDSSSRTGSLAVVRGHAVVAEASWTAHGPGGSLHLDLAMRLLADHGLRLSQLEGVVVATGPGSFTGTRAGISVGQGLAEALSIPLIGVPTLRGLVAQMAGYTRVGDVTCAIVAAGRGAIHAWAAVATPSRFASCGEPVTATVQEVAVALALLTSGTITRVVIGGEIDPGHARIIREAVPWAVVLSPTETQRRAAWLAMLARADLDAKLYATRAPHEGAEVADQWFPEDVQPHYLVTSAEPRPLDFGWRVAQDIPRAEVRDG